MRFMEQVSGTVRLGVEIAPVLPVDRRNQGNASQDCNASLGQAIVEQAARRLAILLAETSAYPLANLKPGPPKP
jgi:hypothetical protein